MILHQGGLKIMGCLFVIILGVLSAAMTYFFGYALWILIVLGVLWLAALVFSAIFGHRGFRGGGNTDLPFVIAGLGIAAAIIIPNYQEQQPCNQARAALIKFAETQREYFIGHNTYASEIYLLNLKQNPDVYIMTLKADAESFMAAATHSACNEDGQGTPKVFTWDSAKGGLQ
jgi:Tfp pilus assembly protein PilE